MHFPIVRRFPAVRAHRLKARAPSNSDDVVNLNRSLIGPVTISQIVSVPTITTTPHPSQTPSSQSPSPSLSSTSSTSSIPDSTSEPTTTTGSNTTISPSPAATAVENSPISSNLAKKKVPSGAIVGMVIITIIVVLGLALFFTRKRFIRNRKRRRPAWGAPIMNVPEGLPDHGHVSVPEEKEPLSGITLPPMSYNSLASTLTTAPSAPLSETSAKVKSTFIPTLPDELSLTMGEVLRVLSEYDDGWVLCANRMGEQGMVPLDCLDRCDEVQDHRLSRRASSLAPKRY